MRFFFHVYRALFARVFFRKLNTALFRLSLHGLGVLNFENSSISGERYFLTRVLPKLVSQRRPVFLDVGANVGDFCVLLVTQFPNAVVHAFEPHPRNYVRLVAQNFPVERVKCHHCGLGKVSSTAILYDRADYDGSSHASLHESVISEIHGQLVVSVEVRIDTLDAVVRQEGLDYIDYLKIDTEGHELAVLEGAAELLLSNKIGCIQFEFNEMNVASRVFLRDFRKALAGYKLFRLLPNGMLPLCDSPLETELFAYQNIVAIRRTDLSRITG